MKGCVVALYIAQAASAPMLVLTTAHLVPGRGFAGNRFYAHRNSEARANAGQSDVTLVEQEALAILVRTGDTGEPSASARRNIVMRGYALHQLMGHRFCIVSVTLHGLAPHHTCASLETAQQDA